MYVNKPTAGIKSLCEQLGNDYVVRVMDFENVIYRNLGNGYDFEISGADHNRANIKMCLYIWNAEKSHIVERIDNIKSLDALRSVLNDAVVRYLKLNSSEN